MVVSVASSTHHVGKPAPPHAPTATPAQHRPFATHAMQVEAEPARPLPWFGAVQGVALVPPEGSLGATSAAEPVAALVLTEGGQVGPP